MKIQVLSDLHLEGGINPVLKDFKPVGDVLVLAGDITSARVKGQLDKVFGHLEIPVIYVLGNHEYYGGQDAKLEFMEYKEWLKDMPNFHILDCEKIKLRATVKHDLESGVIETEDVYFIGATYWSAISPIEELDVRRCIADFNQIPGRSISKHNEAHVWAKGTIPYMVQHIRAEDPKAKIVIVTHFPPSYQAQEERFKGPGSSLSSYFYNDDELLVESLAPNLWIYGHTHGNLRFNIGDVPVITNQMGYTRGTFDKLRTEPCYAQFDLNYVVEV